MFTEHDKSRQNLLAVPEGPSVEWLTRGLVGISTGHLAEAERENLASVLEILSKLDSPPAEPRAFPVPGTLSSWNAAQCLADWPRSQLFMTATIDAVDRMAARRPRDVPIAVLDAGCGPYALLGLVAALRSERVHVVAVDSNPLSVARASALVKRLGLEERFSIQVGDCTQLRLLKPADILVTETFDNGFLVEQGPRILENLAPQIARDGLVLPDTLSVLGVVKGSDCNSADASNEICLWSADYRPGESLMRIDASTHRPVHEPYVSLGRFERGHYAVSLESRYNFSACGLELNRRASSGISLRESHVMFKVEEESAFVSIRLNPGQQKIDLEALPPAAVKITSEPSMFKRRP
jgi:SAM-dependent methyltransferase